MHRKFGHIGMCQSHHGIISIHQTRNAMIELVIAPQSWISTYVIYNHTMKDKYIYIYKCHKCQQHLWESPFFLAPEEAWHVPLFAPANQCTNILDCTGAMSQCLSLVRLLVHLLELYLWHRSSNFTYSLRTPATYNSPSVVYSNVDKLWQVGLWAVFNPPFVSLKLVLRLVSYHMFTVPGCS